MSILELDLLGAPQRTVAPTLLPVTEDEAKDELNILDDTSQDSRIRRLIVQAVDIVERDSRRQLMPQTWKLYLDRFPCAEIELRKVPVASVTHVKYYADEVLTTLSSSLYQTDLVTEPCRVQPVAGGSWPTADGGRVNAVEVQWVAGYANAASVPDCAKAAVLAAVRSQFYGCELGIGYWSLIERIRSFGFV